MSNDTTPVASPQSLPAPFTFDFEGNPIRALTRDTAPWFVLADVCRVLEIANSRHAASRLDDDEKGVAITDTLGGAQELATVNESGLYSLILTSRKPAAKRFRRWVTGEVLPAIHRTGGYMIADPTETPEALAARALTVLQATMERQRVQLAAIEPKADALDLIATVADGSLSVTAAAKVLQMRPKDLFDFLQRNGWLYRRAGGAALLGYSAKLTTGMLEHKIATVTRSDGTEKVVQQVLITPRGLVELAKKATR